MEVFQVCCSLFLLFLTSVSSHQMSLPAYEYYIRFKTLLTIGQCPSHFETHQNRTVPILCKFKPHGKGHMVNEQRRDVEQITLLDNTSQLFSILQSCDDRAADYFGLLGTDDCIATKMAKKISFDAYHVPILYYRYYEPRAIILHETNELRGEYTHFYNKTYYTSEIGIGTEEAIVVVITSHEKVNATIRRQLQSTSASLPELIMLLRTAPSKVKIVRFSSADRVFETKVFRFSVLDESSLDESSFINNMNTVMAYLGAQLEAVQRAFTHIERKHVDPHVKYSFTMYEGPGLALPIEFKEEPSLWNKVTSLLVRAHRIFLQHKRIRRDCKTRRSGDHEHVFCVCPLVLSKMKQLKKVTGSIITARRHWAPRTVHQKDSFITVTSSQLHDLTIILNELTVYLKKKMRKAKLPKQ